MDMRVLLRHLLKRTTRSKMILWLGTEYGGILKLDNKTSKRVVLLALEGLASEMESTTPTSSES